MDDGNVDKVDGVTAIEENESAGSILESLKRGDFYKHRQRRNNQGGIIPADTTFNPLAMFKEGSWEERMVKAFEMHCLFLFYSFLSRYCRWVNVGLGSQ